MDSHQFNEKLEKLRRAPAETKVLKLVLAGHTNAEIARSRGTAEGTIRKQISNVYEKFGIKSEVSDGQSQRDELKALFQQYKPEWVGDCASDVTNEVSNEQELLNQDSLPPLDSSSVKKSQSMINFEARILNQIDLSSLLSSSARVAEGDEDLMSLATKMLEELGFEEIFKVTKSSGYVGYRFLNPKKVVYPYRLILSQHQDGLCISIPKYILEPYLLTLKYWIDGSEEDNLDEVQVIAGIFLVLPSKRDAFLESLHPNYWNILEVERKTIGTFYLNDIRKACDKTDVDFFDYYYVSSSISLQEFNPDTLSDDRSSYLVLGEDKRFSYTWQICISSSEDLQEFIDYVGKILIPDGNNPYLALDDIPF
jgi:hypothetical protein